MSAREFIPRCHVSRYERPCQEITEKQLKWIDRSYVKTGLL